MGGASRVKTNGFSGLWTAGCMTIQRVSEPPLRVLIDARKLGHGGIGEYTSTLIEGILAFNEETGSRSVSIGIVADSALAGNYPWAKSVEIINDKTPPYSWSEYCTLAKRLPLNDYDVFHEPHYTLPFGISIPSVVTVHDLIHIRVPERWYYPYVASTLIKSALRRAHRVVAVSQATAVDVAQLMGGAADWAKKLHVIPNALGASLMDHTPCTQGIAQRLGISGPFFLAIVSLNKPHKGFADLLEAFAALRRQPENKGVSLVVAGQGTTVGGAEGVITLGPVAEAELFDLYASCRALVVPSLSEGFCIPALQAKALGATVVGRPIAALRELLDAHDVICSDMSVSALSQGMLKALSCQAPTAEQASSVRSRYHRARVGRELVGLYLDASMRILPGLSRLVSSPVLQAQSLNVVGGR